MAYSALGLFILLLVIFITYPFIHRYVKNVFKNSFVWLGISIGWFIWALFLWIYWCWFQGLLNGRGLNNSLPENATKMETMEYYNVFGDVSFTAICNFMFFFIPLMVIFNPSKKIVSFFAAVGLFTGVVTLFVYGFNVEYDKHNFFYAIFLFDYGSIFKHFLLALMCFLILFNTPKFNFIQHKRKIKISNELIAYISIYIGYILYVILIVEIEAHTILLPFPGRAYCNTSCLFINDIKQSWSSYYFLRGFENFFWLCPIIFWFLIIGGGMGVLFLFNKVKDKKTFAYIEPKYYYNKNSKISNRKWYSL